MIEFIISEKKVALDFTFFAAIALFFYFDESGYSIMGICACIIHEAGHLISLFIEKKDFKSLIFYGGGMKIDLGKTIESSLFIIIAGSLSNFICFIVLFFLPLEIFILKVFAVINLIIGVFNLLPIRYFDGGRLLEKILLNLFSADKVITVLSKTEITSIFILIIMLIWLMLKSAINPSVFIIMLYVMASDSVYSANSSRK
ncbi:MAG: site-2 protease family protein [Oscillospiraceae bacterium]|nr:site-2 protease family protein [Oscillospiraceae bacterium]